MSKGCGTNTGVHIQVTDLRCPHSLVLTVGPDVELLLRVFSPPAYSQQGDVWSVSGWAVVFRMLTIVEAFPLHIV